MLCLGLGSKIGPSPDRPVPSDLVHLNLSMNKPRLRVMCVSSAGGHLVQLKLVLSAFNAYEVVLVTTGKNDPEGALGASMYRIPEASRWNPAQSVICAWKLFWLTFRLRPSVVVSTGAAPGFLAIRIGRFLGARTIWLDSVANVKSVSMAGKLAQPHCDLFLTQWPDLANGVDSHCSGSVL